MGLSPPIILVVLCRAAFDTVYFKLPHREIRNNNQEDCNTRLRSRDLYPLFCSRKKKGHA